MLIDVFAGSELTSATPRGSLHFARAPEPGEQVEIDGVVLIVARAWHRPDNYSTGPKFAVLVNGPADHGQSAISIHDGAVA